MQAAPPFRPQYSSVWLMFLRNSLVRAMMFRTHFIIEIFTQTFWIAAQLILFQIIYGKVTTIQDWSQYEYFAFMATGMLINGLVEAFFMPNCANFSELIRTGNLDFALLKPIDTQFLISFQTIDFPMINQVIISLGILCYSLWKLGVTVTAGNVLMYFLLVAIGVAFFYSLMIALASTSIWMGRNQSLYEFWFYLTVFARYPQNFYQQANGGGIIWFAFSFVIPILLVVTLPARVLLEKALQPNWTVLIIAPLLTLFFLAVSRWIFTWSLTHYRSASS
ncbi:ABC transporter permease [Planctomicrobium sp. SH668]|uniref:ABC transporter permease n=1 Tax=Planctomicrobium sp. SH668 TaxID=3448126 RepID=UPI003F5B6D3E